MTCLLYMDAVVSSVKSFPIIQEIYMSIEYEHHVPGLKRPLLYVLITRQNSPSLLPEGRIPRPLNSCYAD